MVEFIGVALIMLVVLYLLSFLTVGIWKLAAFIKWKKGQEPLKQKKIRDVFFKIITFRWFKKK